MNNSRCESPINAPGEPRDIVITYDPGTGDIGFSVADRSDITFDHQDIADQLNALDLGCSFTASEVQEWTKRAEAIEGALDGVLNLVAVKFLERDGLAVGYTGDTGETWYAVTADGAGRAGGRRLPS